MGKEDAASFLRSIAYQVACEVPGFKDGLRGMGEGGVDFTKATVDALWTNVVLDLLFQLQLKKSLYGIVDGLDESSSPLALLEL